MTDRELLKQALETLEYASEQTKPENLHGCDCLICTTILALRDRLAQPDTPDVTPEVAPYVIDCPRCGHCCPQPEQEPVAWANKDDLQNFDMRVRTGGGVYHTVPLYTTPPPRPWIGLTDEDIENIGEKTVTKCSEVDDITGATAILFAKNLESKLREKNT